MGLKNRPSTSFFPFDVAGNVFTAFLSAAGGPPCHSPLPSQVVGHPEPSWEDASLGSGTLPEIPLAHGTWRGKDLSWQAFSVKYCFF